MKKISTLIVILSGALAMSSCSGFLDTKPTGTLSVGDYYKTEKNLEAALTGVYDALGSGAVYGSTYIGALGSDGDESYYFRSTYVQGPVVYNHTSSEPTLGQLWQGLYFGISRANLLLHYLPSAEVSAELKKRIRGEALFLRSYYYFMLVQNFGRVPLSTDPTLEPKNMNLAQSSIAQIYDRILKDMTEAEDLVLPIEDINHGGRVSKSAVRGILARVCLVMAGEPLKDVSKYAEARSWALKVIEDTEFKHELNPDFSQIFINYAQDKYDIKESIWEVEFWGNRLDAFTETGNVGNHNGIANADDKKIGIARGFYAATGTLYRTFDANDLRRDWSIAPFKYKSVKDPANPGEYTTTKVNENSQSFWQRYLGKYRREMETLTPKSPYNTPINFPLLRYSDVLLMFAEAENEVEHGPTAEAYAAINSVRQRAFGKLLPGATDINAYDLKDLDYDSFFEQITFERSRELCFEALRKADLIRWGLFVSKMNQVGTDATNDIAGIPTASFQPPKYAPIGFNNVTSKHSIHPIPSSELSVNRLLTQNPLW